MERLTRRINNNKITAIKGTGCNYSAQSFNCQTDEGNVKLRTALEKLAAYEDLEEQGLLVRLPCKPGDIMFDIVGKPPKIIEHQVSSFCIDENGIHLRILGGILEKKQGVKIYFSREAAEMELKNRWKK
ncbi:MAG TPA: hypothetical protein DCW90_04390 [Lachnospiraceae bacterium]|nr:hypothetical protein [Lachnospiraceae bacterium]